MPKQGGIAVQKCLDSPRIVFYSLFSGERSLGTLVTERELDYSSAMDTRHSTRPGRLDGTVLRLSRPTGLS